MAIPVPVTVGVGLGGYGYGLLLDYPWVTQAIPYTYLANDITLLSNEYSATSEAPLTPTFSTMGSPLLKDQSSTATQTGQVISKTPFRLNVLTVT